jgi:hypothetical protein
MLRRHRRGGAALEDRFMQRFAARMYVVIDDLWGRSAERLLVAAAKAGADAVPIRFVQIGSVSGPEISLPSAVLRSRVPCCAPRRSP